MASRLSAFKFLVLIDDDGNVQDDLRRLVSEKEHRKAIIGEIVTKRYPEVVELGARNASTQQLQDAIKEAGASSAILVKAVRFFRQAAEYADLAVSPLWKTGKKTGSTKASRSKPRTKKQSPKDTDPPKPEGQGISVTLPESGATVTLTASVDVMKLVGAERDFLFGLIDSIRNFEAGSGGGGATE